MARLTRQEALHVAQLAALELDEQEVEAMRAQLDAVLSYMSELQKLDLDGVEPTAHPFELSAALRADEVRPSQPRDTYLRAAPRSEAGAFAVPKVLDGDS